MTAADKYYLKAKDCYPYEIEEALEALDYGLSYDDGHAGLLVLKGEIYHTDLKRYNTAIECFELALYHDATFTETYYPYIKLLTETEELTRAEALIKKAFSVKGIDRSRLWYLQAMVLEKQGNFAGALDLLDNSRLYCQSKDCFSFYTDEARRIKKKSKKKKEKTEAEVITA